MCNSTFDNFKSNENSSKLNMTKTFKAINKYQFNGEYKVAAYCVCCGIKLYNNSNIPYLLSSDEFGKTLAFPKDRKNWYCSSCYILEHFKYISTEVFITDLNINLDRLQEIFLILKTSLGEKKYNFKKIIFF